MPRRPDLHSRSVSSERLRRRVAARAERLTTAAEVRHSIISLAAIVGSPVRNQAGQQVGRLVDIVARVHSDERYPPVAGLVVRVGRRRSFIDASAIATIDHREVTLATAKVDLLEFRRRPGEVLLARDVLDHQLVDVDGVQVIRAADLYLAPVGEQVLLVGVDVSVQSLLRRLGPKRLRGRPTPDRVIDWDAVQPFGDDLMAAPTTVRLRASNEGLPRLHPSELADLLEDLRRPARQELLASLDPERGADALEEMEPDELEALLREVEPERAAALTAAMEPDEAIGRRCPRRRRGLDRIPPVLGARDRRARAALGPHLGRRCGADTRPRPSAFPPALAERGRRLRVRRGNGRAPTHFTVSPYMQLYAAAGVVDRGDGPEDYRAARLDAISGALFACFIAMTIIIATGAAIGGEGPLQSAKQSAEALRPVAGSAAVALFLGVRLDRDGEEFSRERGAPEPAHGEEIDRPQPGNFGR